MLACELRARRIRCRRGGVQGEERAALPGCLPPLAPRGAGLYVAPEFEEAVFALIAGGGKRIILDLGAVSFLDSTALGVLLKGAKDLRPSGGEIVLVCRDRNITKILELTGLGRMFRVYESIADAIAPREDGKSGAGEGGATGAA